MLGSELKALYDSYQNIYEEGDGISCEMIEEIVEELVEECVEFGYTLDEATTAVENAAFLFIDEAKVTYGSDTESPEQRRERAKAKVGEKQAAARKAAVKTAVGRAKAKAMGAVAGAGIAASMAKDTARRAGRTAAHKITYGAQKKKAEVKSGVKSLIGRGLRKAAGAVGKVAQKAAGAASRLGEEAVNEAITSEKGKAKMKAMLDARTTASGRAKPGKGDNVAQIKHIGRANVDGYRGTPPNLKVAKNPVKSNFTGLNTGSGNKAARRAGTYQEEIHVDAWDVVLEYLITNGHADTNSEALYIMSQLDEEMVQSIIETRMDPRGRPASGPMNVYAKNKPNTDPKFQAALKAVRDADAKKTPEQRKAELDAYKARQANK
jgi:predicted RNase H-like HicB family nuclease